MVGWERNSPERTRLIYILRNLKNRYMWAGEKVHNCIKHTLRNLHRGISQFSVTAGEIENTKAYIRGSIADIQSLLVDIKDNVPMDEQFFSKVDDERIRNRRNFRKVCG